MTLDQKRWVIGGLGFLFLLSLVSGATVVHQKTLRSQYIVETLRKYRITCTALVPLLLRALQRGIADRVESAPTHKRKLLAALTSLNASLTRRRFSASHR